MSKTVQQDHREKQARVAGEEAREKIMALSAERGRVFLDQLAGSEGADEEAERLDAEIAELERRVGIADAAADEARKQAEEKRIKEEERARQEARAEYDALVVERLPLLENVEEAFDQLDHAISAVQVLDGQHVNAATRAGLPGGGDFSGLLSGRVGSRLIHITGGRYIMHPLFEQPLTESDRMILTVDALEAEQADEQSRREEQAEERRRGEELQDLSDRIQSRRYELVRELGINNADTPPAKVAAVKPQIEEQLKREFPILQKKGS